MKADFRRLILFPTAILLCTSSARAEMRTWTSVSGATVEAELVEQSGGEAQLRTDDGRTLSIRLDQLSAADQEYLSRADAAAPAATPAPRAASPRSPASDSWSLLDTVGPELINARGRTVSSEELRDKVVAIYFSAAWCGPCRRFTPVLVDFHRDLQRDGHPFEVLLVSSDHSERDMQRYMRDTRMPWPAVPHGSDAAEALSRRFRASGIPRLVIVDKDGATIHQSARAQVIHEGADAWDAWMESRAHRLGTTR